MHINKKKQCLTDLLEIGISANRYHVDENRTFTSILFSFFFLLNLEHYRNHTCIHSPLHKTNIPLVLAEHQHQNFASYNVLKYTNSFLIKDNLGTETQPFFEELLKYLQKEGYFNWNKLAYI